MATRHQMIEPIKAHAENRTNSRWGQLVPNTIATTAKVETTSIDDMSAMTFHPTWLSRHAPRVVHAYAHTNTSEPRAVRMTAAFVHGEVDTAWHEFNGPPETCRRSTGRND